MPNKDTQAEAGHDEQDFLSDVKACDLSGEGACEAPVMNKKP